MVTLADLIPRINKRVRIRQHFPNNTTIPAREMDAMLVRVDEANEIGWFTTGVVTIPIPFAEIEFISGGLGDQKAPERSQGSGFGTDNM